MWYLHNEVVWQTPRKFNISRIMRLKVTMKATQPLIDAGTANIFLANDMVVEKDDLYQTNSNAIDKKNNNKLTSNSIVAFVLADKHEMTHAGVVHWASVASEQQ